MDDVLVSLRRVASLVATAQDAVNAVVAGNSDVASADARTHIQWAGERIAYAARRIRSLYRRPSDQLAPLGWVFETAVVAGVVGGFAFLFRVEWHRPGWVSGLLAVGVYAGLGILIGNRWARRWRSGRGPLPRDWPAPTGVAAAAGTVFADAAVDSVEQAESRLASWRCAGLRPSLAYMIRDRVWRRR